jgi:hypothetical protein
MGLFQFSVGNVAFATKGLIRVNRRKPHDPVQINERAAALGTHFQVFLTDDLALGTKSISRKRHRMLGLAFTGTFGRLAMTGRAAGICEALSQKRLVFLLWDAALLPELFPPDVAVETVLSLQRLMHGSGARPFAVAFDASVLGF